MKQETNQRSPFTVTLFTPDGDRSIEVCANEHIWDAAHNCGIELPALCHQGWCLTCAGKLEKGGRIDQKDSVAYFPQDKEAGYILLCTGRPCSDLKIKTNQAEQMRRHRLEHGLPSPYSWKK